MSAFRNILQLEVTVSFKQKQSDSLQRYFDDSLHSRCQPTEGVTAKDVIVALSECLAAATVGQDLS